MLQIKILRVVLCAFVALACLLETSAAPAGHKPYHRSKRLPIRYTLTGPTSVTASLCVPYTYVISPAPKNFSGSWVVNGGNSGFSSPSSTEVNWTPGGATTGTIQYVSFNGDTSNTLVVTITQMGPFSGGTISNAQQTVNYNATPAQFNTSPAVGGDCSAYVNYQWQRSTDGNNFVDVSGATAQNYQPPALTATTWYRRRAMASEDIAYTNVAKITVVSPLNPGAITSGAQSINYFGIPQTLTTQPASGGNCENVFQYGWEYSNDNVNFFDIDSIATQDLAFNDPLRQTTWFRRKVICGADSAYTVAVLVTVAPPISPGTITTPNQVIGFHGIPGTITASPAASGTCSGSYVYQWQLSFNGLGFADIEAATDVNLSYTIPLEQTTYFRRRVQCTGEVRFTNVIIVKVTPPPAMGDTIVNNFDSILAGANINIDTLFAIGTDSLLINNSSDTIVALADSSVYHFTQLLNDSTLGITLNDTTFFKSFPDADTMSLMYDNNVVDSLPSFRPELLDSDIQARLAVGANAFEELERAFTTQAQTATEDVKPLVDSAARIAQGSTEDPVAPRWKAGAVINGKTVVYNNQVEHYTAQFYLPFNGDAKIVWVVLGGRVISQNTNPANGEIYADVRWNEPFFNLFFPFLHFISVYDYSTGQYAMLPISILRNPNMGCQVSPAFQKVFYGQTPCLIQAGTCVPIPAGGSAEYQWEVFDVPGNQNWVTIPGATGQYFQPPAHTRPWLMYRRHTIIKNSFGVTIYDDFTPTATVRLQDVQGGILSFSATELKETETFSYNTQAPVHTMEPAYGGMSVPNSFFNYVWQYQENEGAWTDFGTGVSYPTATAPAIRFNNTKIRRVATLTGPGIDAPILVLPSNYWRGISNVVTANTKYQTVDFENRNYIRQNRILAKGITTWEDADLLGPDKKAQATIYFDGLGRGIQSVDKGVYYNEATNQWYDMVAPVSFEAGGVVTKMMLPYPTTSNFGKFKTDVETAQPQYFQSKYGDNRAFMEAEFDGSPLYRSLKTKDPGSAWGSVETSRNYDIYRTIENVRYWIIGYNSNDLPYTNSAYAAGNINSLIKFYTVDEHGKKVVTYVNKAGQVILKKEQLNETVTLTEQHTGWLCTYYVYDDFGNTRFIIPPKAVAALAASGSWQVTRAIADELCFIYEYDERRRLIVKKTPGKDPEYVIYDQRNRVVFTQDGNQRQRNEWMTTLYDDLNRKIATGIYTTTKTPEALKTDAGNAPARITNTTIGAETTPLDLDISQRVPDIRLYKARNSVGFSADFETESGAEFETIIGENNGSNMLRTISYNPIPASDFIDPAKFTPLTYSFYDDYTFSNAKPFTGLATIPFAYKGGELDDPSAKQKTARTIGMVTGTKLRVMDESGALPQWLVSTTYYDEEGRPVEKLTDNVKYGTDMIAAQYLFDGRVLSTCETHTSNGTGYTNFPVITKYKFDRTGKVTATGKKLNNTSQSWTTAPYLTNIQEDNDNGYKLLANRQYDELGRLVKKKLAPQYDNGQGLETIDYDYNIRGWLTGINKNYVLNEYAADQWQHFFGMYIGFDNADGRFANAQYNGNITGVQWKSQGDNTPRKYDYSYDNVNRLTQASFTQKGSSSEGWNNTRMDFTVKDIAYDENGNLLGMTHMGVMTGMASPVMVDKMNYTYQFGTNRLIRIDDLSSLGANNGKLGDFKDGANGGNDYDYDANGNLLNDQNKDIRSNTGRGISYNYLNKPTLVNIEGKGTIKYIYDAGGNKLQKIVTDNTSGGTPKVTTTTYIGPFVYDDNELQYILTEEGRIRLITPINDPADPANQVGGGIDMPGGKQGVFDYFITDHLGNVRSVITEEINKSGSVCTMEDANTAVKQQEEAIFGQPGTANEVSVTRHPRPNDWTSATQPGVTNDRVSRLIASGNIPQTGPNSLIKVMAGDLIRARTDYYYASDPGSSGGGTNALTGMLQSLGGALLGGGAGELAKGASGAITNNLGSDVALQTLFSNQPSSGNTNAPRAYLNYIFFDEQLNYIAQGSGFLRVQSPGNGAAPLVLLEAKAPKNGYVYVYVSNESTEPVYFDNFAVTHERGRLVQEDHYYAFGLRIAAISSKAGGTLKNNYQYQGMYNEFTDALNLNWNEFALRNYDPQTGRWTSIDPFDEYPSPYVGMGNNPANFSDPSGGFIGPGIGCPSVTGAVSTSVFNSTLTFIGVTTLSAVSTANAAIAGQAVSLVKSQVAQYANASTMQSSGLGNAGLSSPSSSTVTEEVFSDLKESLVMRTVDPTQQQPDPYSFCGRVTSDIYDYVKDNNDNFRKHGTDHTTPYDDCITLHIKILKMLMPDRNLSQNIPKVNYDKYVKLLIKRGLSDEPKTFQYNDRAGNTATKGEDVWELKESVASYLASKTPEGETYVFGGSFMDGYHVFTVVVTRTVNLTLSGTENGKLKYERHVTETFEYMDQIRGVIKFESRGTFDFYMAQWVKINAGSGLTPNVRINQIKK